MRPAGTVRTARAGRGAVTPGAGAAYGLASADQTASSCVPVAAPPAGDPPGVPDVVGPPGYAGPGLPHGASEGAPPAGAPGVAVGPWPGAYGPCAGPVPPGP